MGGRNGLQRLILFFAAPRTPMVLQSQNGEADRRLTIPPNVLARLIKSSSEKVDCHIASCFRFRLCWKQRFSLSSLP
jgi:hypothetical protein